MPVQNLLDINADKLFEEHTITEIIEIQKKLQCEIERKREELRTMVGEGYRDLIEAADTITDMKTTAEEVISHIERMSSKCQQLQQRHLLGFKFDMNSKKSEKSSMNKTYNSIAIQIKILMDIPEQIWSAVEKEDFLLSVQLFLFARHINTGLELHMGMEDSTPTRKMMHWFPVVLRQWNAIVHFRTAILVGCHHTLQAHDLSPQRASSCLSTLVLLEGFTSLELLNKLLELRTQALQQIVQSDQHASVKFRISLGLQLLVHTISLLHTCFFEGCQESPQPEGLVWKQLKSIVGREAPPSLSLVDLKDAVTAKFLPPLIQDFRPSTAEPIEPVRPGDMRESVSRWLDWMRDFTHHEVSALLELVGSVKGLASIRDEASPLAQVHNWDTMCQRLLIPRGLNLWESFLQPLLTHRAKALVLQQWQRAVVEVQAAIKQAMGDITQDKCSQPEHDLRWFVWKEWSSDLPQGEFQNQGLQMKAKGYSPCVDKLCSRLNVQLEALLQDLQPYLGEPEPSCRRALVVDCEELQDHLQTCSSDSIQQLIHFVKTECVTETERSSKQDEACLVLMARFLQALCDLCPNLQKCLTQTNKLARETDLWLEVCELLRRESLAAWHLWRVSVSGRLRSAIHQRLPPDPQLGHLLHSFPQWDVVSIEEESEEGRSIQSDIRVPSQATLPLQSLLLHVAQEINAVAPHTLPRKIHQDLVERLVADILDYYEQVSVGESVYQAQALQFLLDIKYLTMLLVPRDNKVLIAKSQGISDKYEDKIDPFDLDVFCPYIQNNIKKSVQRSQCLLGVLVAWPDKLAIVSGLRASNTNLMEDPSVLPLSAGVAWFPLLPVTGASGARLQAASTQLLTDKPQTKAVSAKPRVEPTPGEIVRSSAAAFFGAMSSEWFGTG